MSPKNRELAILDQIRKIRNNKGYSQQYMASQIGLDQSSFQKIESGASSLKLHQFFTILNVLEIEVHEFLTSTFKVKLNKSEFSEKILEIERLLNEIKTYSIV